MSNYTAETPARCPKCGGALTERIGRSMGEVVYMYDCGHCDWDDEYARADRLTVATAPWSRDLWAEVERLTHAEQRYNFWAEVSTDHRSGWCGEHPRRVEAGTAGMVGLDTKDGDDLCLACELLAAWAERDAAAAKERAAIVAWLRATREDLTTSYDATDEVDELAAAIEAGDHLEVSDD